MRTRRLLAAVLVSIGHGLRLLGNLMQHSAQRLTEENQRRATERTRETPPSMPQPLAFWPGSTPAPPEHWLERVHEGAPWLLDQLDLEPQTPRREQPTGQRPRTALSRATAPVREVAQRWLPPRDQSRRSLQARSFQDRAVEAFRARTSTREQGRRPDAARIQSRQTIERESPAYVRPMTARPGRRPNDDVLPVIEREPSLPAMSVSPRQSARPSAMTNSSRAVDQSRQRRTRTAEPRPAQVPTGRPTTTAAFLSTEPHARTSPHRQTESQLVTINEWPVLPERREPEADDWSSAMRLWDRQRRLEAEQRGEPWNARRS